MTARIIGSSGGKRRRRVFYGTLAATVGLVAFLISYAGAVHDFKFQLDGDVSASTVTNIPSLVTTTVGGTTTTTTVANQQNFDWDSLFNPNGDSPQNPGATPKSSLPAGFSAAGFHPDFQVAPATRNKPRAFDTGDDSTYATGSKDTLPIQGSKSGSGWQCSHSNNVGGKFDIMNAYAAAYTDPGNGHQILYFAQERNSNNGAANVGFWFLQDGTVDCSSTTGAARDFSGHHKDGDLLVVSEFSNGGAVSTIKVYEWESNDPTNGDNGSLNPTPVASGADCEGTGPGDAACATVNKSGDGPDGDGTIPTPWLTANADDGLANQVRAREFFEGGLDLTASGLGGCFSTFIANTRSSPSLDATIFDFARGDLELCGVNTAQKWLPQDTATVTGGTGTVEFKLYENGTCTAPAAQTFTDSTAPYETNNTTYYTESKTISWSAKFTPSAGGTPVFAAKCERSDLTINNSSSDFTPPSP